MLGRRGLLGGALGLLALSACDTDDLRPPEDEAEPTPSPSASAPVEPDADSTLVEEVLAAISVAADHVAGARGLPRLRRQLGPLARAHDAHLAALDAEPSGTAAPVVPTSPAAGIETVREQEQLLQRTLTSASVSAQSGALARLLASMSASIAQHVHVLPAAPPVGGGPR